MATLEHHPIADTVPLYSGARLSELVESIVLNGLRYPITTFEGKILDGRNRYRACGLAGVKPTFTEFHGSWDEAVDFVMDVYLHQHHDSASKRSMVGGRLAGLKGGRPAVTESVRETGAIAPVSRRAAAQRVGVSEDSIKRARQVLDSGVPELVAAVDNDEVSVSAAAQVTKLPPEEQQRIVAEGPAAVKKAAAEVRARPIVRRTDFSPAELADQAGRKSPLEIMGELIMVVKGLEGAVQSLSGHGALLPDLRDGILSVVQRLRAGTEWLEAAAGGTGFSDDSLAEWLTEGEEQ